ncbi:hypothetical protein IFR04_015885 [Cadophora malorum]|uniref:Carrier domain-containing protein n=1 Tax=Cadophora malorum TaxID=108018 RepID=A0A8H7T0H2_9HELO|nr:hypothetical protein IFR04_015885 [Cadophora malorum]
MHLLSVTTLTLHSFIGEAIPPYAILSHVWGPEEVSYVLMAKPKHSSAAKLLAGFSKIEMCCKQAQRDGHQWVWVDTCCIDKRSSAELSEAINSMFLCSGGAEDEAAGLRGFGDSRWFTRGWTLQELLAPRKLVFFARDWNPIGYMANYRFCGKKSLSNSVPNGLEDTNIHPPSPESGPEIGTGNERIERDPSHTYLSLASQISLTTNIPEDYLTGKKALRQASVAQRMFWAARRKTTREEDHAYSLMGLFDINMPILYGEGLEKAFTRLQHEIMLRSPDQSILLWYKAGETSYRLLAESPDCFQNSGGIMFISTLNTFPFGRKGQQWSSSTMTNLGLHITLPILAARTKNLLPGEARVAVSHCVLYNTTGRLKRVGLNLHFLQNNLEDYPVFSCHRPPYWVFVDKSALSEPTRIYLCGNDYISRAANPGTPSSSNMAVNLRPKSESLELEVCKVLARVAGVAVDNLTGKTKIKDLGIDSSMALEVIGELSEAFKLLVPLTEFFRFLDVRSMCSYYRRELSVDVAEPSFPLASTDRIGVGSMT